MVEEVTLEQSLAIREALKRKGSANIVLVSGSMAPLLKTGAQATLEPCRYDDLKKYDVIVFWNDGKLVCHVFWAYGAFPAANGERTLVTKGLQGLGADGPIHESWLLGRVTSHHVSPFQFHALYLWVRFKWKLGLR